MSPQGQPPYGQQSPLGPSVPPSLPPLPLSSSFSTPPSQGPSPYTPPTIGPAQPSLGPNPSSAQPLQPLIPLSPNAPPPAENNNPSASAVRSQVADSIKNAVNVLVTVSTNPSVDQLATAIGLTLVLNKMNKHGTAVFSGEVPSTIEFLQPEQTLEKNTDSLRDFIIALDKAKADKLRYKLEDKFVKIFITPYHTSLSEDDLEFSQGDFNVDVVVALGVKQKGELDQAITAHGRILHDASVVSINNSMGGELGTINLTDTKASSLSEIVVGLLDGIDGANKVLDGQIATAFLTGIVAETERFSNDKTSSLTMNTAAKLMSAGANQQLIATKLEEPKPLPQDNEQVAAKPSAEADVPKPMQSKDGSLQIEHDDEEEENSKTLADIEEEVAGDGGEDSVDKIHIDKEGTLRRAVDVGQEPISDPPQPAGASRIVTQPPVLGSALSANTKRESVDPSVDLLTAQTAATSPNPVLEHTKAPSINPNATHDYGKETLDEIEQEVASPHAQMYDAKPPVMPAPAAQPTTESPLQPIAALNAQPVDLNLGHNDNKSPVGSSPSYPEQLVPPAGQLPPDSTAGNPSPSPPPPVPPPFMPPNDGQLPPPTANP